MKTVTSDRILLLDAKHRRNRLLAQGLEDLGLTVIVANSIAAAVQQLKTTAEQSAIAHLMIVWDESLFPKEEHPIPPEFNQASILITTSSIQTIPLQKFKTANLDYITKPFSSSDIIERIN
ncbi:MAG: hypothetical protein F6K03_18705, partial [Kamptonema sp. SIO4C4]|nr:hypothetical protein [Kamptonema sp. SIO4C4]